MGMLLLLVQLALSFVLVTAALAKALRPGEFVAALRSSALPNRIVMPVAVLVPAIEALLSLAIALGDPGALPFAFAAAAVLLAIFTIWMTTVYSRYPNIRCGCFGAGSGVINTKSIMRNILILTLSLCGIALSTRIEHRILSPSLWTAVAITSADVVIALALGLWIGRPGMVLSLSRLHSLDSSGSQDWGS